MTIKISRFYVSYFIKLNDRKIKKRQNPIGLMKYFKLLMAFRNS